MTLLQIALDPFEAASIADAVTFDGDIKQEMAATRVAIKLDVVARGYRRMVVADVDEFMLLCQFAHHSACRIETVADIDAVLEEFLV